MYENILVALDGSASSKNALRQAVKFAKLEGAEVAAVSVIPFYEGQLETDITPNLLRSIREPVERILIEAAKTAEADGVVIDTMIGEGDIHEAIINASRAKNSDLIVVGRRGLTRLSRAFMGSVTARVIGHSPVDVLVVQRDSELGLQNILLATDGSEYSEVALGKALSLARAYKARLNVISVIDLPEESYAEFGNVTDKIVERTMDLIKSVKGKAEESHIEVETFIKYGESYEQIVKTADELGAGLICLGSHGRTSLARLLMGSTAERVIGDARQPVLVIKSARILPLS